MKMEKPFYVFLKPFNQSISMDEIFSNCIFFYFFSQTVESLTANGSHLLSDLASQAVRENFDENTNTLYQNYSDAISSSNHSIPVFRARRKRFIEATNDSISKSPSDADGKYRYDAEHTNQKTMSNQINYRYPNSANAYSKVNEYHSISDLQNSKTTDTRFGNLFGM